MSTTTTTEVSSNSNSSCRLLECLNSLPFHDQRVFRSLLGHIELVRLSACCRSLRSSIRNDTLLWQKLYHRDFLSGAHYAKEMEFVLWCIRTDVNNPCTSDKRADLLENVDWYNTYRRRVSTENNWRYGRCNISNINMEHDKDGIHYRKDDNNCIFITQQDCSDGTSRSHPYHALEYLPHSNFKSGNNTVYNSTLPTSSNVLPLDIGNETKYFYVTGDHYIAVSPRAITTKPKYTVKILTRKHGGVFTTFDVPVQYKVKTIQGKWVSLVRKSYEPSRCSQLCTIGIMVFDIENNTMCPGSIGGIWNATRFYKTTNNTAIVYTTLLVENDDTDHIEWALYQFSNNNPVVQLRSGWFQLPERITDVSVFAHNSYDLYMVINIYDHPDYDIYIMHSVASSGQSHIPRNCYTMTKQHISIPLLRAGCEYLDFGFKSTKIWTDLSYNNDQVLQIPNAKDLTHIIGNLYVLITKEHNYIGNPILVDISTNEIIRKLEALNTQWRSPACKMFGIIGSSYNNHAQTIQEYGEL